MLTSLYAVLTSLYAVLTSLYAVLASLYAVLTSLYAVLTSLYAVVKVEVLYTYQNVWLVSGFTLVFKEILQVTNFL